MKSENKNSFWENAERPILMIATTLIVGGIGYLFHCLRESKKVSTEAAH